MKQLQLVILIALAMISHKTVLAQSMIFTTKTFAATQGGPGGEFENNELLVIDGHLLDARHFVPNTALSTMLGDADGDFNFNDFDKNIDAIALATNSQAPNMTGLLLSVDQTMEVMGGTVVDGDVFAIEADGQINVIYPEVFFATATQTSTIDVDAFHEAADGTLYFSFANDEVTTSNSLATQNNGAANLDESTVFMILPGSTMAQIAFTKNDILQVVSTAMGTTFSTIVDLTAFAADPASPGDFIFGIGSTNSAIEGRLFSTANGGSFPQHFGNDINSATLGFIDEEVLEGIAFLPTDKNTFRLFSPTTVPSPAGTHSYAVEGATPFQIVQLFASHSVFPAPSTLTVSNMSGFPYIYVNPSDPLFGISVQSLDFSRYASSTGAATITFVTNNLPVGLRITMQAVDVATNTISMPASAGI